MRERSLTSDAEQKEKAYRDVRQMGIQDAPVFVVSFMDLQEVGAEIGDDRLVFIRAVTIR